MSKKIEPQRGEVWYFRPGYTVGSEIQKPRPAVIVNEEFMGRTNSSIIVPITGWKHRYEEFPWIIFLRSTKKNGLDKDSGVDASQVKSISIDRFNQKIGIITLEQLYDISAAIALCIGYECPNCRLN